MKNIQLILFCLFLLCTGSNLTAQSDTNDSFRKHYGKKEKVLTPDTGKNTNKVSEKSDELEEKERMKKLSSGEIEVELTVKHHNKKFPEPIKQTSTRGFSKPSQAKIIPAPLPPKISLEDQIKAIVKEIDTLNKSDDPNKEAKLEKLYKLLDKKKLLQSQK